MLEDIDQLQQMSRSLEDAYRQYQDRRMQRTLFIFSMVSAVFLPMQFISGVYGMNFVAANDEPGIPELAMKHGYLFFWLLELSIVFVVVTFFIVFFCPWCGKRPRRG